MLDPIVRTIEVPCGQAQAFDVFVHEMGGWWPLAKFTVSAMGGHPAKTVRVEPKRGGSIVEIGPDDAEHRWGTIEAYDPPGFVSMSLHFAPPGVAVTDRTHIEVRFTALSAARTRVELTQSNWEAFGEQGPTIRGGYEMAWTAIFERAYKTALGG